MPRAIVGPGSRSKRSCSSDSIWRGANLSCSATSSMVSACASRACLSSAPMPVSSVKASPLKRLELGRARKAPPQLVGVALLGNPLAGLPLDAQREPERLGVRLGELVVAPDEAARLVALALVVADLAEVEERRRLVGLQAQRALQVRLGFLRLAAAQRAHAGRAVRAPRRGVERILDRLHEVLERVRLALRLAQEEAIVVIDIAVTRRETEGALEALLRESVLAEIHVDQPEEAVRRRVARIGGGRDAQLLQRHPHAAALVVRGREVGVVARAVPRVADLADDRAAVGGVRALRLGACAGRSEDEEARDEECPHARASLIRTRWRRVRSATAAASWPQAAAMSSPRVLRVVTVRPAPCRISAKRRIRSGLERL